MTEAQKSLKERFKNDGLHLVEGPTGPVLKDAKGRTIGGGGGGPASWGSIGGNINDQKDLKSKLDGKASTSDLDDLTGRVGDLENDVEELDTKIGGKSTVSVSPEGTASDTVYYITVDGVEKKLPSGEGRVTAWGSIGGNIDDQTDLKIKLAGKASTSDLETITLKVDSIELDIGEVGVEGSIKDTLAKKSTVSVSATGEATDVVEFITIDGVQKKLIGGGSQSTEWGHITGNISRQRDLAMYLDRILDRNGDSMSGQLQLLAGPNGGITSSDNVAELYITGGTTLAGGANLLLHGKESENGCFELAANNGSKVTKLEGDVFGNLKWDGQGIILDDGSVPFKGIVRFVSDNASIASTNKIEVEITDGLREQIYFSNGSKYQGAITMADSGSFDITRKAEDGTAYNKGATLELGIDGSASLISTSSDGEIIHRLKATNDGDLTFNGVKVVAKEGVKIGNDAFTCETGAQMWGASTYSKVANGSMELCVALVQLPNEKPTEAGWWVMGKVETSESFPASPAFATALLYSTEKLAYIPALAKVDADKNISVYYTTGMGSASTLSNLRMSMTARIL